MLQTGQTEKQDNGPMA